MCILKRTSIPVRVIYIVKNLCTTDINHSECTNLEPNIQILNPPTESKAAPGLVAKKADKVDLLPMRGSSIAPAFPKFAF